MHRILYGGYILLSGLLLLAIVAFNWFKDIINESTFLGYHTLVVRKGLKIGFILFLASEVMLFLGFF